MKVKCRPLDVAFGGKQDQDECIVSVNMDGRTILLYNLHDQENALELAFQVLRRFSSRSPEFSPLWPGCPCRLFTREFMACSWYYCVWGRKCGSFHEPRWCAGLRSPGLLVRRPVLAIP